MRPRGMQRLAPYLFLFPGFALFVAWSIYPLLKALQISFYDWKLLPGQQNVFVGLGNYQTVFADPIFWVALRNTVMYTTITVIGQMVLGLGAALLVNQAVHGRTFFRTLYYFPVITSWVVVSLLFAYLFNSSNAGIANYLLVEVLHVLPEPIAWLSNASTAWVPIMGLGIWKGVGWSMLIFLAALQSVPTELYEVAAIDGANGWQRLLSITLPLIRPTLVFVLVMLVIGGFQAFISIYLITGGGPLQRTEVLLTHMYNQSFRYLRFGYGAALSYVIAVLVITVSFVQIRFLQRRVEY